MLFSFYEINKKMVANKYCEISNFLSRVNIYLTVSVQQLITKSIKKLTRAHYQQTSDEIMMFTSMIYIDNLSPYNIKSLHRLDMTEQKLYIHECLTRGHYYRMSLIVSKKYLASFIGDNNYDHIDFQLRTTSCSVQRLSLYKTNLVNIAKRSYFQKPALHV